MNTLDETCDQERDAFFKAYMEHTQLAGHEPTSFDVWLMARGRMDTSGRAIPTQLEPDSKTQSCGCNYFCSPGAVNPGTCRGLPLDVEYGAQAFWDAEMDAIGRKP